MDDKEGRLSRGVEQTMLDRVRNRGRQLRRRRRIATGSAATVSLAAMVVIALVVSSADGEDAVTTAQGGTTSTTPDSSTSSTDGAQSTTTSAPTTAPTTTASTTVPTTEPSSPPTTSARAPSCRNSFDPACGPFYWDPEPGPNAPLTVNVSASTQRTRVGEEVVFTVEASDPDQADIVPADVDFDDGTEDIPIGGCLAIARQTQYGPWTPTREPGNLTQEWRHAYDAPGVYQVRFVYESGTCTAQSGWHVAYGSRGEASLDVIVE